MHRIIGQAITKSNENELKLLDSKLQDKNLALNMISNPHAKRSVHQNLRRCCFTDRCQKRVQLAKPKTFIEKHRKYLTFSFNSN